MTKLPAKVLDDLIIDGLAYHDRRATKAQRDRLIRESLALIRKFRPDYGRREILAIFRAATR